VSQGRYHGDVPACSTASQPEVKFKRAESSVVRRFDEYDNERGSGAARAATVLPATTISPTVRYTTSGERGACAVRARPSLLRWVRTQHQRAGEEAIYGYLATCDEARHHHVIAAAAAATAAGDPLSTYRISAKLS